MTTEMYMYKFYHCVILFWIEVIKSACKKDTGPRSQTPKLSVQLVDSVQWWPNRPVNIEVHSRALGFHWSAQCGLALWAPKLSAGPTHFLTAGSVDLQVIYSFYFSDPEKCPHFLALVTKGRRAYAIAHVRPSIIPSILLYVRKLVLVNAIT